MEFSDTTVYTFCRRRFEGIIKVYLRILVSLVYLFVVIGILLLKLF